MSPSIRFWISAHAAYMAGSAGVFGGNNSKTNAASTVVVVQSNKRASSARCDFPLTFDNQSATAGQASSSNHSWKMMMLFQIPMVFTYEATFGQTEKIPI